MKHLFILLGCLVWIEAIGQDTDVFLIEGREVRVSHQVDTRFYGRYSGQKNGYLLLNENGTGEYKYDIFGFAEKGCTPGVIRFEWGLLIDDNNQVIQFKRDYGFSVPVIYRCIGTPCFQGCRKNYLLDYLLVKTDGKIEVSSSDDWVK